MYGDSVFLDARAPRRGWSTLAGFTVQCALLGAALLVPLLSPEGLPRVLFTNLLVAPAPPPGPPPAPPESALVRQRNAAVRDAPAAALFEPVSIPDRAARIVDDAALPPAQAACTDCVEGSIEGGATGGLIGSLMQAVRQAVLPPPPPPAAAKSEPAARPIPRIVMGGEVQEALLTHKAIPVYPPLARQMRIQGEVKFSAIISREGMVQNLTMLYGHPMLVPAAAEAIRQWRYRPTILNGQPHEVVTTIIVTFKLN